MTGKTQRSKGRKSTDVRKREIVDAAMGILAREGSRHFTAKNIAAAVGITPGAIFRHFPAMDAIADAIIDRMEEVLFEGFPPADEDPVRRLEAFFRARTGVIVGHPHIARLLLSNHLKQAAGPDRARRVDDFKVRTREFIVGCIKEAAGQGMIRGAGPEECTILVLGTVFALAQARNQPGAGAELEGLAERSWALLQRIFLE